MFEVDTSTDMDCYDFVKWLYEDRIRHIEYVLAQSAKQKGDNKLPAEKQMELEKELKQIKEQLKRHSIEQDF
jgi:hypothetical protein